MRDDAVQAVVGAGRRDDDHLALGLREAAFLLHQRVVIREERAELVGAVRQRDEHVRDEPRLLLHLDDARADVVGQFVERRDRIAADGRRRHRSSLTAGCKPGYEGRMQRLESRRTVVFGDRSARTRIRW